MKIITFGYGHIGSVLVKSLLENLSNIEIIVSDSNLEKGKFAYRVAENLSFLLLDASNPELVSELKDFDLAVGLTPGKHGFQTMKACIQAGVDMVDLSFMPEDPFTMQDEATRANVTIIPDCGFAPGLSNMLVGRAVGMLERVEEVVILVGGIPEKPFPPLDYKVTWCAEDLIEEYTRKAKIVKDGKVLEVDALSGLELVDFPEVGRLEAFYTDGVRTLHHTIKGVRNMWEKTLRYPGHADKIKLLRDLGMFEEPARGSTIMLLDRKLAFPEIKDMALLSVKVKGMKEDSKVTYTCSLLDKYDEKENITAMARTTAYTASILVKLLAENAIAEKGVVPPEKLGMNDKLFSMIFGELKKKGIEIKERFEETE